MKYLSLMMVAGINASMITACGSDDKDAESFDDSTTEPSRDERIDDLAEAACDRYADTEAGCPGYGTADDQPYQTADDCERDFEARASDLWPNDECGHGEISASKYQVCEDRVKLAACSQGVLDAIAALGECSADSVCVDPANTAD